jgi:DNA processing protein
MTAVGAAERTARAGLTRVCEPDDVDLRVLVDAVGATESWARLVAGDVPDALAARTRSRVAAARPDADLHAVRCLGGRLLCPGDEGWPAALADLPNAPLALWVRGAGDFAELADKSVAIVGSRAATSYGVSVAADFAAGLADAGWQTVSGGAYGVDAAAHRGSLAAGGATIAILACGVGTTRCSPRSWFAVWLPANGRRDARRCGTGSSRATASLRRSAAAPSSSRRPRAAGPCGRRVTRTRSAAL